MKPASFISTGVLLLLLGAVAPMYAQQDQHQQDSKPQKQEQQAKPEKQQQQHGQQQQQHGQQQQAQHQQQAKSDNQQHQQQQAKSQQDQQQKQQHAQQQQQARSDTQHQQQQAKSRQDQQQKQQHAQQQQQSQNRQQQQQHQQQANRPSQQHGHPAEQQAAWQGHRARDWKSEHRDWQQRGGYHGYRIPDDRYRAHFGRDHWFRIYSYPVVVIGGYPRFQYGGFWFSIVDPWPEYWSDDWYDNDDVYVDYSGDGYYLYNRRYPGDRIAVEVYLN